MSIFRDIDGVIKSANATEFGLASGVMTNDLSKALEVCKYMLGWMVTVVMIFYNYFTMVKQTDAQTRSI